MNNSRVFSIKACRQRSVASQVRHCKYQSSGSLVFPTVYYSTSIIPVMALTHVTARPLRMIPLCNAGIVNLVDAYDPLLDEQPDGRGLREELWL